MEEYFFQCPYCWQNISMLLDPSISNQNYIEDCENCCNPLEIKTEFHNYKMTSVKINRIE